MTELLGHLAIAFAAALGAFQVLVALAPTPLSPRDAKQQTDAQATVAVVTFALVLAERL